MQILLKITLLLLPMVSFVSAQSRFFESQAIATNVIELFTSEGCSSCPAADRWLSSFTHSNELFKSVVPLAFHVDYWDWIGWPDRFASKVYTQRQRNYVRAKTLSQSYTPGILVNSQEWRQWFKGARQWPVSSQTPGVLKVNVNDQSNVTVQFESNSELVAYVAILGMGLKTEVRRGENTGKALQHDFVVLNMQQQSGQKTWTFALPDLTQLETGERPALAVWVSEQNSPVILQAVGGYL